MTSKSLARSDPCGAGVVHEKPREVEQSRHQAITAMMCNAFSQKYTAVSPWLTAPVPRGCRYSGVCPRRLVAHQPRQARERAARCPPPAPASQTHPKFPPAGDNRDRVRPKSRNARHERIGAITTATFSRPAARNSSSTEGRARPVVRPGSGSQTRQSAIGCARPRRPPLPSLSIYCWIGRLSGQPSAAIRARSSRRVGFP
jgi:hypothetical protein